MQRRVAVRKRDIHREEQRRAKGAKPYMMLENDTLDERGAIIPDGKLQTKVKTEEAPKPKPKAKKPAAKKKAVAKKKDEA